MFNIYTFQLGFFLLIVGTMIYNSLMTITGVSYPTSESKEDEITKAAPTTTARKEVADVEMYAGETPTNQV